MKQQIIFFSNKHLVFTGTLSELSRDEAKYLAKTKGAKILSSISKKTDFLIAGEKAGSKIDKARQLGVKILNEKEFLKKINLKFSRILNILFLKKNSQNQLKLYHHLI